MRMTTWADMTAHVGRDVKAVGVCNFSVRQLTELLAYCKENKLAKPAVVQNECHPLLQARGVRKLCRKEGIVFQAYASLGAGQLGLVDHPVVVGVSKRRGVTPGQVLLRWAVQHGCSVLPKSVNEDRQAGNLDVLNWDLTKEDMEELDKMEQADSEQNTMVGWLREHDPDFY